MKTERCKDNHQRILTEVQDVVSTPGRASIRGSFMQKSNDLRERDYKDLDKTLKINKDLIATLIKSTDKSANPMKDALAKLNEENGFLMNQIKTIKKQRDDYHGKYFLSEQIIEELKEKNKEELAEHKAKVAELLEELNQKEYVAQFVQYRYNKTEAMLKKCAMKDHEVTAFLKEMNVDLRANAGKRISTVVEETKLMMNELAKAQKRIQQLESTKREPNEPTHKKLGFKNELSSSSNFKKATQASDYNSVQMEELFTANEQLNAKIRELEEKNHQLEKINLCLHSALQSLKGAKLQEGAGTESGHGTLCKEIGHAKEGSLIGASEAVVKEGAEGNEGADAFNDLSSIINQIE